jgi:hypothetical protein
VIGVFHHHELAIDAGHFQPLQPGIAADAVLLMHYRRTEVEIGQIADNGVGIAVGNPSPGLPHPLAVQLRLLR